MYSIVIVGFHERIAIDQPPLFSGQGTRIHNAVCFYPFYLLNRFWRELVCHRNNFFP